MRMVATILKVVEALPGAELRKETARDEIREKPRQEHVSTQTV